MRVGSLSKNIAGSTRSGLHPIAPAARNNCRGLAFMLDHGEVVDNWGGRLANIRVLIDPGDERVIVTMYDDRPFCRHVRPAQRAGRCERREICLWPTLVPQ
jgi:hypothetical protein